jgi:DNA-binding LacI/PurR family transcriptional regulator
MTSPSSVSTTCLGQARSTRPTVVAQPTHELGMIAAQLLLDRIKDHARPYRHVILDTQLIVRKSSGPHR